MKIILSPLLFLFFVLTCSVSLAQTFSYENIPSQNPSSCFFFSTTNPSPPIPINGYSHYGVSGGVIYNGSEFVLSSTNTGLGTAFGIYYPFSAGSKYKITVTASAPGNEGTSQLQITTNSARSHSPTGCIPEFIGYIGAGADFNYTINLNSAANNNYIDFTITNDYIPSVSGINYLLLASKQYGAIGGNHHVRVKTITIVETVVITCNLPAPTGLGTYIISNDFAGIEWNQVSNAVSYSFDYKATTSSTWITPSKKPLATSVFLTGLSNGTTYDIRARANCAINSGPYATSQFITTCNLAPVTNLNGSAVTSNTSTITWTYPANPLGPTIPVSFNLEYKDATTSAWNVIVVPNSNPSPDPATIPTNVSYQLTGLSSAVLYDLRVRANCQTGSGNYVATQFPIFTCDMPTGLSTTALNNFATLQWDRMPLASSYDVQVDYDALGSHNWVTVASGINPPGPVPPGYVVYGLNATTTYAWRVRAFCANSQYSNYTTPVNFTTLPNCIAVISNLTSSGITSSSVTVSWTNSNSSSSPIVEYKTINASNWTCAFPCYNYSNPTTIHNLSSGTTYLVRVTPFCGYTSGGPYGEGTPQQIQITTLNAFGKPDIFSDKNSNNAESISTQTENTRFSETKKAKENVPGITVYPSPANNQLTVSFNLPAFSKLRIYLINPSGIEVYSNSVNSNEIMNIDVSKFANGLYFLKVESGTLSESKKILIQH